MRAAFSRSSPRHVHAASQGDKKFWQIMLGAGDVAHFQGSGLRLDGGTLRDPGLRPQDLTACHNRSMCNQTCDEGARHEPTQVPKCNASQDPSFKYVFGRCGFASDRGNPSGTQGLVNLHNRWRWERELQRRFLTVHDAT